MRRNDSIMDREVCAEWRRYNGVFSRSQAFLLAEVVLEADGHFTLKPDLFIFSSEKLSWPFRLRIQNYFYFQNMYFSLKRELLITFREELITPSSVEPRIWGSKLNVRSERF